ncbi:MAG: DUF4212 domain-containing protein [Proteobacteria bacterium]|nr:DUF4212 domain-containing protein [Pseudomonadota bacterium]
MVAQNNQTRHWLASRMLMWVTMVVWAIFGLGIHLFADALNSTAFPGAYFMAGTGAQLAFVILIFWANGRQNAIDAEHGLDETEDK